ncbi:hypothetical protein EC545_00990 [Helicobacter pylori]|uniref:hypothetical protein n=1 Tax=Helicobacter pylori TaxID=210 RepID=UPI00026B3BEA|nr:hypothetical protein HPHPH5B_0116 [Helicobacter pylori Hp H-5b]RVZ38966.1 hypothetical protein EC545_00990 [Helicobacter pylori]RVZ77444.1 hypothetical protein EC593_02805 [Helicobacter pylori]
MNGGSYKKGGFFNFGCFRFVCKKDFSLDLFVNFVVIVIFLNFLKRIEKYSVIIIPQKLKGFFKKWWFQ